MIRLENGLSVANLDNMDAIGVVWDDLVRGRMTAEVALFLSSLGYWPCVGTERSSARSRVRAASVVHRRVMPNSPL
jgi:hypothetical protein